MKKNKVIVALLSVFTASALAFSLAACGEGASGEKGDGDTGVQGIQGEKGDTGAQGPKGDKGDTGAQGPKGDKGDTGAQGPKGDKGDTGAQGPKGDKGDTGADGNDGATWLSGAGEPTADTQANAGDFYLDTQSCLVYKLNEDGAWEKVTSLRDPHEHTYEQLIVVAQPSCDEAGYALEYCTECGEVKAEAIPASGHKYSDWEVSEAPTADQEGKAVRHCSVDNTTDEVVLPVLTSESYTKTDTATCTEAGVITYTFTADDGSAITIEVDTPAKGHDEGEWNMTKAPTTKGSGTIVKTCTVCGMQLENQTFPMLSESNVGDGKAYQSYEVTAQPTCTETGVGVYTPSESNYPWLNERFTVELAALGHSYSPDSTADTVRFVCSACGDTTEKYAYDESVSIAASNTAATSQALQDGAVYYVQTTAAKSVAYCYSFTVTQEMVDAGSYNIDFVPVSQYPIGVMLNTIAVGDTTYANSRGVLATFTFGTVTTENATSVPGENFLANNANLLNITFNFTADQVGKKVVFSIRASQDTAANKYSYYLMGVNKEISALEEPEEIVAQLDTPATIDTANAEDGTVECAFVAPQAGWYTVDVPEGVTVSKANSGAAKARAKAAEASVFKFYAEKGEKVVLIFTVPETVEEITITVTETTAPEEPVENVLGLGENSVTITDSYTYVDSYTFTAPQAGNYTITVPEGMTIGRGSDPLGDDFTEFFDSVAAQKTSFVFTAEENEAFRLWFYYTAKGTVTVTFEQGGEAQGLTISPESSVELTVQRYTELYTVKVADGVEEGEYGVTVSGGVGIYRSEIYIKVNGETYTYSTAEFVKGGTWCKSILLKGGDEIEISANNVSPINFSVSMAKVEEDEQSSTLGLDEGGSVQFTFNPDQKLYNAQFELAEEVTSGTYQVTVSKLDGEFAEGDYVTIKGIAPFTTLGGEDNSAALVDGKLIGTIELDIAEEGTFDVTYLKADTLVITLEKVDNATTD